MNIAIIGAGNSGSALAADYAGRGHCVTLIKSSHSVHEEHFQFLQEHNGEMILEEAGVFRHCRVSRLSRSFADVRGQDLVILCTQSVYHRYILKDLLRELCAGQILLINPGYLSTAYVLDISHPDGLILAESESNFIDGRLVEPGHFRAGFRNVRNPIGVYPSAETASVLEKLNTLGTPFTPLGSVVEAALHNPNMIVHTVGSLMSLPRIESGDPDFCMYHEAFTPSVWRILEALDQEKMDILAALGAKRLPYVEACKFRNSLDDTLDARTVFFDYAGMPTRAKGPFSVESRYITEDVSQGLVLLESLGQALALPTATATALITIACAALGRDLRKSGRSVENLGKEALQRILADATS